MFVADIDHDIVSSKVSSFAGDTKITMTIADSLDLQKLKADVDHISKWAVDNKMVFDTNKFVNVKYSHSNKYTTQTYSMDGHPIKIDT